MFRRIRAGIPAIGLLTVVLLFNGCDSGHIIQSDPLAPSQPGIGNPPNGAVDYPAAVTFTWSSSDPSGDSLTYDLYFGEGHQPQLVASGLTTPDYHISTLRPSTEYHWRVVAHNPAGKSTRSPNWKFETWEHPVVPVVEGARWRYEVEVAQFNVRNATGSFATPDTIRMISVETLGAQIRAVGDNWMHEGRLIDSTYHPVQSAYESGFMTTNTESAYYRVSRPNLTIAPPSAIQYTFRGNTYGTLRGLRRSFSHQVGPRPEARPADDLGRYYAHELLYPLEVGQEWTYSGEPGERTYKKKVIGREVRDVQGRPTECFVVEWQFDYDGDGVWEDDLEVVDYYSVLGRVYSRSVVRDVDVTSYADPYGESGAVYDVSFEDVVTDIYIPEFPE